MLLYWVNKRLFDRLGVVAGPREASVPSCSFSKRARSIADEGTGMAVASKRKPRQPFQTLPPME
jgi:hypothetical protein